MASPGLVNGVASPGLVNGVASPGLVNGVAYLADGHTATFVPQSHAVSCGYHGNGDCSTVTVGILETGGAGVRSSWPHDAPLDRSLRVREPVWTCGIGAALIDSDGIAMGAASSACCSTGSRWSTPSGRFATG